MHKWLNAVCKYDTTTANKFSSLLGRPTVHISSLSPCLGGHHFLGNRGVMNFRKYLGNIFVTPLFDDQKFYEPLRSYNVEETCNPQCA